MPDKVRLPHLEVRLLRSLGAGRSGEVWLAQDADGALVVVKLLQSVQQTSGPWLAALEERIRRVAAIGHPHILRLASVGRVDERIGIAMEYAPGGDLSALRGRPWPEVITLALPVIEALAALHRAGIVHRDVKTTNVLRMADGSPRLADLEAAVLLEHAGDASVAGSLYSVSPAALCGEPASCADDVYGFGAMLYELLSGYPPFYPHVTATRIRDEVPARIETTPALPEALQVLVARCLRKSDAERPSSMEVAVELGQLQAAAPANELLTNESKMSEPAATGTTSRESMSTPETHSEGSERSAPPVIRPPSAPAEPLRSEWRRPAPDTPTVRAGRAPGTRRALMIAGLVLAALALFIVFFALPKWVDTAAPPAVAPPVASTPTDTSAPVRTEPVDFAALARAKQEADEVRQPLFERLERLRERAAETWAAEDVQRALQTLADGDAQYAQREYIVALEHFERLAPLIDALERRAPTVLQEQLDAGSQALQAGRSEDAKAAFELALRIEPNHARAQRGRERAETLDRALALLSGAQRAEQEGDLATALAGYRDVLALDRDMTQASEGVARLSARQASDAFASAMARGFAALGANDYDAARRAFEDANRIRPNTAEVAQALKQIEQSEHTLTIAQQLEAARAAEAREGWAEALKTYQSILALDSTVAAAKEGVMRVKPRAELNAELELYLTQPERLFSAPVRAAAHRTLERASGIANPGPMLSQQLGTLRDWLAKANVPVRVALQSDNMTQVTIFRVGALGAFEQRSLELEPGEYTVVGTRPGYRDVRREIMVVPGQPMPPIDIRCEDRI